MEAPRVRARTRACSARWPSRRYCITSRCLRSRSTKTDGTILEDGPRVGLSVYPASKSSVRLLETCREIAGDDDEIETRHRAESILRESRPGVPGKFIPPFTRNYPEGRLHGRYSCKSAGPAENAREGYNASVRLCSCCRLKIRPKFLRYGRSRTGILFRRLAFRPLFPACNGPTVLYRPFRLLDRREFSLVISSMYLCFEWQEVNGYEQV